MEGFTLNLSNKGLKKLDKLLCPLEPEHITTLDLSRNNLQRLDNIEMFYNVDNLIVNHNQLLRMYYISKLKYVVNLDLSHNHILHIEGLKELKTLKMLNLSFNNIKVLDASHLQTNFKLENLDLSNNNIAHITNISFLTSLKMLYLHNNQITHLRHCELYLPISLETLTLNNNNLADLNEVSHLVQLYNLTDLSFAGNPCLFMTGNNPGFDCRPFILNWCMNLHSIDGFMVDDLERLKAEWLYSQGRGRKFRVGEHSALVRYLAETCPMTSRTLESEQERKLRIVLSKAQQYQRQLTQEDPDKGCLQIEQENKRCYSADSSRTSLMSRSFDPSLLSKRSHNPPSSSSSASSSLIKETNLSRSVNYPTETSRYRGVNNNNSSLVRNRPKSSQPCSYRTTKPSFSTLPKNSLKVQNAKSSPKVPLTTNISKSMFVIPRPNPLPSTSVMLPAPDNIVSPCNVSIQEFFATSTPISKQNSIISEADGQIDVLESNSTIISHPGCAREILVSENKFVPFTKTGINNNLDYAATCIQKVWRGYRTRVCNRRVVDMVQSIQTKRFNQYIKKLNTEMEATREALAKEHQLQILQMEAINALWKKIASLQIPTPMVEDSGAIQSPTDKLTIKALAATCTNLDSQVQQLQNAMQEILRHVSQGTSSISSSATATATQTEIVAVHTPSEETNNQRFPYQKFTLRPSSLPLPKSNLTCKPSYVSGNSEMFKNRNMKTIMESPQTNGEVTNMTSSQPNLNNTDTKRETSC